MSNAAPAPTADAEDTPTVPTAEAEVIVETPELTMEVPDQGPTTQFEDQDQSWTDVKLRTANLIGVTAPFVGFIVAIALLWQTTEWMWLYLSLMFVFYVATGIGITVGYHRYFTHRSFRTNRVVEGALAVLGGMAVEGSILQWCAVHRKHHQHSDEEHDPHSPHGHGDSIWGMVKGMWHAHMGWMFVGNRAGLDRYVVDLHKDPIIRWMSDRWWWWTAAGFILPGIIAGAITQSWMGAFLGFLWGGPVRVVLVHHVTYSINSVCHIWGSRPFKSHDHSRNNLIFGLLGFGEGWHNNHHAFPTSARHGLRWWEIDTSWMIIRGLAMLGLASDVRVPSADRMKAKRRS